MIPLTYKATYQVDIKIKDMRWSCMINDKVVNNPTILELGVAKPLCPKVSKMGPQSHVLVRNRSNTNTIGGFA